MSLGGKAFSSSVEAGTQPDGSSSASAGNSFGGTPGQPSADSRKISDRLAAALKRRIRPWSMSSALTVKDVARAIGASEDTVSNWLNGRATPNFDKAGDLFRFFASLERSPLLLVEVFSEQLGDDVVVMSRAVLDRSVGEATRQAVEQVLTQRLAAGGTRFKLSLPLVIRRAA